MAFISIPLFTGILFKLILFGFFIFWNTIKDNKAPYVFYQNLGVSLRVLFLGTIVIDSLLLIACYKLIEFIL